MYKGQPTNLAPQQRQLSLEKADSSDEARTLFRKVCGSQGTGNTYAHGDYIRLVKQNEQPRQTRGSSPQSKPLMRWSHISCMHVRTGVLKCCGACRYTKSSFNSALDFSKALRNDSGWKSGRFPDVQISFMCRAKRTASSFSVGGSALASISPIHASRFLTACIVTRPRTCARPRRVQEFRPLLPPLSLQSLVDLRVLFLTSKYS